MTVQIDRDWITERPGEFHTWEELLVTGHMAHQRQPFRREQACLLVVCEQLVDPLCRHFGLKARITSGFRSLKVNGLVGGVPGSRHTKGMAVDLGFEGMSSFDILRAVKLLGLDYDKLIAYHPEVGGHVHGSWVSAETNRRRMLECFRDDDGDKAYRSWSP